MAPTVAKALDGVPLKMLKKDGDPGLKNFQEQRRAHGRVLERAIQIAGLTKKEATERLGIEQQSQLTAWLTGAENPQTWRFQQHPTLGPALLLAQAEDETGVVVRHVIEMERKVG